MLKTNSFYLNRLFLFQDSSVKINIIETNDGDDDYRTVKTKELKNVENNISNQKPCVNNTNQDKEEAENITSKPNLPPVPVNSFQFLNDWNEITPYPDLRYQYLKVSKFIYV